jgi:hypothetical protein
MDRMPAEGLPDAPRCYCKSWLLVRRNLKYHSTAEVEDRTQITSSR